MAVYPQIIIEAFLIDTWVDISSYVIGEIDCSYGILGNSKVDRLADVGELSFTLNNADNRFTPYSPSALPGWKKGINVRLKIIYVDTVTKFYGHIDSIEINTLSKPTVDVTALDYMDYLANHPLTLVTVDTNKRINEIASQILSGMPVKPLTTEFGIGQDEFLSIFDTTKNTTKASGEFNKLALSEWSYIYVKHGLQDEIFCVEGRHTRNFRSRLTKIPKNGDYLTTESGDYLITESGDRIMLNSLQDTSFDNNMIDIATSYGDDLVNSIIIKSYPRKIDTEPQVLYSLDGEPIELRPGESKKLFAEYRDPNQLAQSVTGKDFINPEPITDYLMFRYADGFGDITSSLQVNVSFTATTAIVELTNIGSRKGYVAKLNLRGYGIYLYSPIEYRVEDTTSILEHGVRDLTIDMKYQHSPHVAKYIADITLNQLKQPIENIESVSFLANSSDMLLLAFMFLDVGSLIYLKDDQSNIDSYFYINGIEFTIQPGGIIHFDWILTDANTLDQQAWVLGVSKLGLDTIIRF